MLHPTKILIVNLAGLGDIILSSAAIKALKEKFKEDEIFLLTFADNLAYASHCPYLSGVFSFDKNFSLRNIKTIVQIHRENFDQAVNLYNIHTWRGAFKIWFIFLLINAKETFGRNTRHRGFFYNHQLNESGRFETHDSQVMVDVIGLMGADTAKRSPELWIEQEDKNFKNFLLDNNMGEKDSFICIHPGATKSSHRWPIDRFAFVGDYLAKKYRTKIIVTGNKKDSPLFLEMQKYATTPLINACGKFSLSDLVACLKKCKLFITNDTGPMHVASVLGIPTVVIAGNSPRAFLPETKDNIVILRKELKKKPSHPFCLKAISSAKVLQAANHLLFNDGGISDFMDNDEIEPIKVLHLHTRAIIGGSSTNALLSLTGLPKRKYIGHLACGQSEAQNIFIQEVQSKNIPLYFIKHLQNKIHLVNDSLAFFEIVALMKKEKYTIVHTHNSKAGILGRLAAKACGVPYIIHTIHSCEFNYPHVGPVQRKIFLWIEKMISPFTDHFIAISEHIRGEFLKYHIAPPNKIAVIYSGIELEKFKKEIDQKLKRKELGLSENDCVVGVVSRLDKGKGHEYILRAIPQVLKRQSNTRFLFVGDGPLRYTLENFAENANIHGHVIFTGLRLDVAEILKSIDVFCSASLYEGMGRVVLEAQASGKPVVANHTGGIPNIVLDKKTAILIEPKNETSLSQALIRLIEDKNLRHTMGKEATEFVDERFSAQKMVNDINKLYADLLTSKEAKVYV